MLQSKGQLCSCPCTLPQETKCARLTSVNIKTTGSLHATGCPTSLWSSSIVAQIKKKKTSERFKWWSGCKVGLTFLFLHNQSTAVEWFTLSPLLIACKTRPRHWVHRQHSRYQAACHSCHRCNPIRIHHMRKVSLDPHTLAYQCQSHARLQRVDHAAEKWAN